VHTLKLNNAGIFADPGNLKSLADSVIVSVANTALSLLLGTLAGMRWRWIRGAVGENLAFWILSNRMFPPVTVIIPMFFLFDSCPGARTVLLADRALSGVQPAARHLADDGVFPGRSAQSRRRPISMAIRRCAPSSGSRCHWCFPE
jgi:hypothetical protein